VEGENLVMVTGYWLLAKTSIRNEGSWLAKISNRLR
jgi:hypothetical protein